jgi:hypothetical protein
MNKPIDQSLKPITIFLCITLALSAIFYFLIIYSGTLGGGGIICNKELWCPGISADYNENIKRDISDLGWKWEKTKYQIWVISYPTLIAYLAIWIFGWGGFYNEIC